MVFARFLPKDEAFFGFFADAAANAAEASTVLSRILATDLSEDERARQVSLLREIEHRGDEISHQIFKALHSTFVTPLDREDIQHLTSTIDTFVDRIDEVATRFHLYRLGPATAIASHFARLIAEQGAAIQPAVSMLEHASKHGSEIRDAILTIHRLENEGDDLLNRGLAGLYDGVTEVSELISCLRWGELYQLLEDVTDSAEDVADVFEGIMITYA